jgi:hypothetical protein
MLHKFWPSRNRVLSVMPGVLSYPHHLAPKPTGPVVTQLVPLNWVRSRYCYWHYLSIVCPFLRLNEGQTRTSAAHIIERIVKSNCLPSHWPRAPDPKLGSFQTRHGLDWDALRTYNESIAVIREFSSNCSVIRPFFSDQSSRAQVSLGNKGPPIYTAEVNFWCDLGQFLPVESMPAELIQVTPLGVLLLTVKALLSSLGG